MSCDATRQGDEMYCSRCSLRWDVAAEQTGPCQPVLRRPARRAAPDPEFNARALVADMRGWVTSVPVLLRMEAIAREAYARGKKSATDPPQD